MARVFSFACSLFSAVFAILLVLSVLALGVPVVADEPVAPNNNGEVCFADENEGCAGSENCSGTDCCCPCQDPEDGEDGCYCEDPDECDWDAPPECP